jgi:tetratricopeptide (TPR) repeat protein/transcriptional regulator with XRE-family HTH domain
VTDDGDTAMAEDAVATAAAGTSRRERLAQRRKALGLTQENLAALLGVERSTVVRWERGETEPLPWIRPKLAKALRISADRLEEVLTAGPPDETRDPGNGRGDGAATAAPRQLPAAVTDFTGRAAELDTLTRMLDEADASAPGTVVISAVGGTAGVGKTALALHWAHGVAHRFGDGQLYVNLRGFDPSGIPASPAEAIRGFLDALDVAPGKIPPRPEAQAALYRTLVADRKMLIVLDNARDEQQVRPLLPPSPGSLVLVTSRRQLTGLAAADGARLLSLDVLPHAEAVQLLTARIGVARAAAEPAATAEIATRCACLPLALAVAAARAVARPGFPLSPLAAELRDNADRLEALDSGDPSASVRAVFSWSCRQLSTEAARMFRLLGLHPGPDISVPAAASLAARHERAARRLLGELSRAHLITEHVPGRFAFHDLLRGYALIEATENDSDPDRAAAVSRLLDHYLHTTALASTLLYPGRESVALQTPSAGATCERPADYLRALAWFEGERHVLIAAVNLADSSGRDVHTWQLAWAMKPFMEIRGHHHEYAALLRTALMATARLGDLAGEAMCSRLLATALTNMGDYEQALGYCTTSLELCQRLGNDIGEAKAYQDLCQLAGRQGHYAEALGYTEQALRLFRAVGNKSGEAASLSGAGWCHARLGHLDQADEYSRRALTLCAEVGHRFLEGYSWDCLGFTEHSRGNLAAAADCYQRALAIFREMGDRRSEADVLIRSGDTCHVAGELPQARDAWRQALTILEAIEHPDADTVRAKLAGTRSA